MSYLNKMTVKELREIAKQMGLKIPGVAISRATKDLLVTGIEALVEIDHMNALAENELFDEAHKTVVKAPQAKFMPTVKRIASYHAVNGSKRLTKRQQRRVAKKFKVAIKRGYGLDVVMV